MKLAYQKLLEDNKLTVKELPKDARIGIRHIDKLYEAIQKNIEAGVTVSKSAMEKLRANDKWIVAEILDYLDEKENPEDHIPHDSEEIEEEIEELEEELEENSDDDDDDDDDDDSEEEEEEDEDADEEEEEDDDDDTSYSEGDAELGLAIDTELDQMQATGKSIFGITEIRSLAPSTYEVLFNSYQKDQENGIVTSKYELIEVSANSEQFKLTLID
jgi:cobalamin biosynthesis protein CobT